MTTPLTKEQAAILSAFTGVLCCHFPDFREYAERIMGRPIASPEFADPEVAKALRHKSKDDFMRIAYYG